MPKVSDIMTKDVVTVTPQTSLRELAQILSSRNINGVPVVDDQGAVLGVVCEADLVNQNRPLHIPTFFVILDSMIPMENPWKLQKEIKARGHSGATADKADELKIKPDWTYLKDLAAGRPVYSYPLREGGFRLSKSWGRRIARGHQGL